MKATLFIFFVLFTFRALGQKDEKVLYPSGEVALIRHYNPSCDCIKETGYYEDGKRRSIRTFIKRGFPNGEVEEGGDTTFYDNGVIAICFFFKDGVPDGRRYSNDRNGKLTFEAFYSKGFKTGISKYYDSDGTLIEEKIYEDNKTHWVSDTEYVTDNIYFHGKLAYIEKQEGLIITSKKIIDQKAYDELIASEPPTGKRLFENNCGACHAANTDIVGPMMKGVTNIRSDDWLTKWIVNAHAFRMSGDKEAIDVYNKWNQTSHPNYQKLSPEEVKAIIEYLKTLN